MRRIVFYGRPCVLAKGDTTGETLLVFNLGTGSAGKIMSAGACVTARITPVSATQ